MGIGGSYEGAKQSPRQAECTCGMLFVTHGMLKIRERLNTLQMCEVGWEKSYKSGMAPVWKKYIEVRLFPRPSHLATVRVAEEQSRRLLTLLRNVILLMKHGYLSIVSLLLEDILLHQRLHHSPLLQPQRQESIHIRQTAARWWFCNWAR